MAPRTLSAFFGELAANRGEYLVYDDGYRSWSFTYADTAMAATAFAARLRAAGITPGQAIAIWAENRAEWVFALWGCLLEGVVLVPVDHRASADFLVRVAAIVDARVILAGDTVDISPLGPERPVWPIADLRQMGPVPLPEQTGGQAASGSGGQAPSGAGGQAPSVTAEIIFTSGATADPKGVIISHQNILANIVPIELEVAKYKRYAKPFLPIRFLNLLPLSHMFGQAMAAFVPPMIPGTVVFTRSYAPEDIIRQIRTRRISVLVCVPKMLEVLRDYIVRVAPETTAAAESMHWTKRWWRYRRVHRMFGFKFWAMVVGAAPLDPGLEAFWGRLGFLVIQGYGLTETAPIVTLNHPLRLARGAVGKPIAGVEVKIADDGEILVRGENVTSGYYNAPEATRAAFVDGWFHTGDIGEFDEKGQLHIRGRKKEMIVTAEGLNVFPEDVERALNAIPGVIESAVVGAPSGASTSERVHAIIAAAPDVDLDAVVRQANETLADHQRIRAAVRWPEPHLPRTEGTRKLKRREIRQWMVTANAADGAMPAPPRATGKDAGSRLRLVLEQFAPGRTVTPTTTIGELGLSSLERVELMMALEDAFQVTVDESGFSAATSVHDLEALVTPPEIAPAIVPGAPGAAPTHTPTPEPIAFPAWNRSRLARAVRRASLPTWILPGARQFMSLRVTGLEHLADIPGPVIFAANHQSHLDTPAILQALPPRWRYRLAPAMAKEFFKPHFYPDQFARRVRLISTLNYYLATLFFNAFPLPQRESGTRQTLRYIGDLIGGGDSVLIFPEGRRTEAGEIAAFQAGVAMIAARLDVPVVPVRLEGLDRILHHRWNRPRRGTARVTFGRPMLLKGNDYSSLAAQVEQAVRDL
jgi:long-chain acyl-CoA synthetase